MLWYVLQSIDISASPTSVSACGGSSTLSTTAYFKLFTKNEDNTTSASTNTSETVTASASYSENKSYTSVSGSKITFDKNKAGDCYGADSRNSTATASYTFSGVTKTDTVTITQNANPLGSWYNTTQTTNSISISPYSMSFDSAGGTQTYSVTRYYTQYEARQDSCGTVVCTNSYNTSSTVRPSDYDTTGDFECTSSSVSIGVNSGSERSGKLTVSYDGKSDSINLSQRASQAGTSSGEPYDYTYDFSVSVSPWNDLSCDGGTTYATATFTTYWKYDWEETNDAGEVINSGTSSDSSSSNVTNSTTWSTDRGSISSNGTLTYPASTSDGTTKTTVTGTYNGYSDSDYMTQVDCSSGGGTSCMTIRYTLTQGAAGTVYFKTTNGTQEATHYVDATGSQLLCNVAEGTTLVVTHSNTAVTVGGDTSFVFTNGGEADISLTLNGTGSSDCTCSVSNVTVTPSSYTLTSATDSKSFSVTVTDNDCSGCTGGWIVYNSSGTRVTSGTGSSFSLSTAGTYTIRAKDNTGKTDTVTVNAYVPPTPPDTGSSDCTCSVSNVTVTPTTYTYSSTTESKSFSVTVTDNDCSGCTGEFSVYKGSTYITSGTSSFSITNGDGTYTIRAKDNTGKTATVTLTKYTAPSLTCNPLFLSYDDPSHTMTATFDKMVASDVTINFKVKIDNSTSVDGSIKIEVGNNSGTKTLSTSQAITSTAGTSVTITSISPASDTEYEYNCDTDWEIIPSDPTCDCTSLSISCSPATAIYNNGAPVTTTVFLTYSDNCLGTWKAYSNTTGELLGSGSSGDTFRKTTLGTVTFRADSCTGKTCTFTVKEPTCAKPLIQLDGNGESYTVESYYDNSQEWCDSSATININTSATYIGDGGDYSHLEPTTCSFSIGGCAAAITSFQLDSGGWILDSYSGLNSFGLDFTIRPDALVNATCCVSGTFTYNIGDSGDSGSGTFNICIQFNG